MNELNNELNDVVEAGTEVAEKVVEEVAADKVVKTVNFKKVGIATLITGGVILVAGVVIKKRDDIKAWWNRRHGKQETYYEPFDDFEDVVDETEE